MARYVDIENCEEFVNSFANLLESCYFKHREGCLAPDCRECLRRHFTPFNSEYLLPTADVRPEKYGVWEKFGNSMPYRLKCLICGWDVPEYGKWYSYCPNCGAKMDREEG